MESKKGSVGILSSYFLVKAHAWDPCSRYKMPTSTVKGDGYRVMAISKEVFFSKREAPEYIGVGPFGVHLRYRRC